MDDVLAVGKTGVKRLGPSQVFRGGLGSEEFKVIGKIATKRIDAYDKVAGNCRFTVDLKLSGMLYGKILRSPHAHAEVISIDASKAKALPGVKAVITVFDTDVPRKLHGLSSPMYRPDQYGLFNTRVRFLGDGVAAVAAISEETAEGALEQIHAEYEELPAVFDAQEAMKPGAPLIHDDVKVNIAKEVCVSRGNIERGFAEADITIEGRYETQAQQHCSMEPYVCIAKWDPGGKLTMWISCQSPFGYRRQIAEALDLSPSKVRVIVPEHQGGAFGGKLDVYQHELICAFLAKKTGKPVYMEYTREECFCVSRTKLPTIITLSSGIKEDGTIVARSGKVIGRSGGYSCHSPGNVGNTAAHIANLYDIPNYHIEACAVYTNNPLVGAFRGYGNPQATFATELHMDRIATELGIDPIELRLRHIHKPQDVTAVGYKLHTCGLRECIEKGAKYVDWPKRRSPTNRRREGNGKHYGIGIACVAHFSGFRASGDVDASTAEIRMQEDSTAVLNIGSTDLGTGSKTALSLIAAEELGLKLEDITIITGDTDLCPFDHGSNASRLTSIGGRAVQLAAMEVKRQLFERAAEQMEVDQADLKAGEGRIYLRKDPSKFVSISAITNRAQYGDNSEVIMGHATYDTATAVRDPYTMYGDFANNYSFGAQIAEVEVDSLTGVITVLRIVAIHDVGRVINPAAAEGQVFGGVVQGIGWALTEELIQDAMNGAILNPSFLDYKLPTAGDIPDIVCLFVETNDPNGPYGAKGLGEMPHVATAPAIGNAVYNAIGKQITSLPMNPEKLWKSLS